jgi:hypothetical protein
MIFEGLKKTKDKLRKFKIISGICELDSSKIKKSLNSDFKAFEDSLQLRTECDIIITKECKRLQKITDNFNDSG